MKRRKAGTGNRGAAAREVFAVAFCSRCARIFGFIVTHPLCVCLFARLFCLFYTKGRRPGGGRGTTTHRPLGGEGKTGT